MIDVDLRRPRGVIFGTGGGGGKGGGGGGSSRVPVEDQNTLRSRSFGRVLDLLSEGEIGGLVNGVKSIYFNDTPWYNADGTSNFDGVTADIRYGAASQPSMPAFSFTENPVEVPSGDTVSRYSPMEATINQPGATAALVTLRWQQLSWQNPGNGDLKGFFCDFKIEVKTELGAWQTAVAKRLSGKTVSGYEETFRIELPSQTSSRWVLRVSRVSPNDDEKINWSWRNDSDTSQGGYPTNGNFEADINGSTEQALYAVTGVRGDRGGSHRNSKFFWATLIAVTDARLTYPFCAYVGLQVDSQGFGGQIPRRSYEVYGIKVQVPDNYDPITRTYAGAWGGGWKTAWTNNPAWIFYDLLSNDRYGLGDILHRPISIGVTAGPDGRAQNVYVSALEAMTKWQLYEIAKYCDGRVPDGKGGYEPRFTLNAVINTRQDAFTLIQSVASAFRSIAFWAGGAVYPVQDSYKDVSAVVTPANVVGGFTYRTTSQKARHTVAFVTWNDPDDLYRPKIEMVEDADGLQRWGQRPIEVVAYGCTSRAQAVRFGRWLLYTDQHETETVSFTVSFDNLSMLPGDIVAIADPAVAGARLGGRLRDATAANAVELDAPITMLLDPTTGVPYTYDIAVVLPSGTVEVRRLGYQPGDVTHVVTTVPFSEQPSANAMWAIVEGDASSRLFRVLGLRETAKHTFAIDAVLHKPGKWDFVERDIPLPDESYSRIPTGPLYPPTNLTIQETLYRSNNTVRTKITLSWQAPQIQQGFMADGVTPRYVPDARVRLYTVEARGPSGAWAVRGETTSPSFEIADAEAGFWGFRVYARSVALQSAPLARDPISILGKTAPPQAVTGFTSVPDVNGVWLSWSAVPDLDIVGYEIRDGEFWDTAAVVTREFKGTSMFVQLTDPLQHILWIKAKDDSGNYSLAPDAYVIAQVTQPQDVAEFDGYSNDDYVKLAWKAVPGIDITYEIRAGRTWDLGQTIGVSDATTFETLYPTEGNKTFWIKAKSKLGLYSAGARFITLEMRNPSYRNIVWSQAQRPSFPGYRNNMVVDSGGGAPTGALMIQTPNLYRQYGEYFISVNLGASYTGRAWLQSDAVSVSANPVTWQDATFSWGSEPAQSGWFDSGESIGAQAFYEISIKTGYGADVLYHWPLVSGTTPAQGTATFAAVSGTPTYQAGRWAAAMRVKETDDYRWTAISVTSEFTLTFGFTNYSDGTSDLAILQAVGTTARLWIGYEASTQRFVLYDQNRALNAVTLPLEVGDHFNFVVSQTATARTLAVYSVQRDMLVSDERPLTPAGAWTSLYLNWNTLP